MVEVYISNEQNRVEIADFIPLTEKIVTQGIALAKMDSDVEVSVTFTDNQRIQQLNKEYRHKDIATDVLSFAQDEGEEFNHIAGMPRMLGDVVISLEKAVEQSQEYCHSLRREVGYLVAHGILHLLGYDHGNEDEQHEMRKKEEQLMEACQLARE